MLELLVAAVLAVAPWVGRDRAREIARPIAAEVANAEDGLMLITVQRHESDFIEAVRRCEKLGDEGEAFGAYQLQRPIMGRYTPEQVCADDRLQARLALRRLGRGEPIERLTRYMGRRPEDPKIQARLKTLAKLREL